MAAIVKVAYPKRFQVVLDVQEQGGGVNSTFLVAVRAIAGHTAADVCKSGNSLGHACEQAILTALARVVGTTPER